MKGVKRLSVTELFKEFLPNQQFAGMSEKICWHLITAFAYCIAHRALPDVEAVEALFMSTPLEISCLC